MRALLSIKPEFAEAIFSGKKKFEYRKVIFKEKVRYIQVYATKPIGKIIGEFEIGEIIRDDPAKVWKKTRMHSGIKKSFYMQYFQNRRVAYAIEIKAANRYKEALCPYNEYNNFIAPQSFRYIKN